MSSAERIIAVTLYVVAAATAAVADIDMQVVVRLESSRAAVTARSVGIRNGAVSWPCEASQATGTYHCRMAGDVSAEDLVLNVETDDPGQLLPREIGLQPFYWEGRTRSSLTVYLAAPRAAVAFQSIEKARILLDPPAQLDRALAVFEALNERRAQGAGVAALVEGTLLFNYARVLHNLCLSGDHRYATCSDAAKVFRRALELQQKQPTLLAVGASGYNRDIVIEALADIATHDAQLEEAKRGAAYERAVDDFRARQFCGSAERFASLTRRYDGSAVEAVVLRRVGVFGFHLTYHEGLAQLNCGRTRIEAGNVEQGCSDLKAALERLSRATSQAEAETRPDVQRVLWETHMQSVRIDVPKATQAAHALQASHCR